MEGETTLIISSIEKAPIRPGEPFGPCVLSPGLSARWTIGSFDGDGWFDEASGLPLYPRKFSLLPQD